MARSFVSALVRRTGLAVCLTLAALSAACAPFIPTGRKIKVTLHLQQPVAEDRVVMDAKVGRFNHLENSDTANAYIRLNSTNKAKITTPFTLTKKQSTACLTLEVEKDRLLGETIVVWVQDRATGGDKYFGFEPYVVENPIKGTDQAPAPVAARGTRSAMRGLTAPKSGTPIKIK